MHLVESFIAYKVNKIINKASNVDYSSFDPTKKQLKILLIGYSGKRNVGAEVRCAEIIKQLRSSLVNFNVKFGVLTLNAEASKIYYPDDVQMVPISSVFFSDLLNACSQYHIGILAEGSCLTGVTSNVAAMFFICAAGILKKQKKLCIAYGVEAGPLSKNLIRMTKRHFDRVHFVARTVASQRICQQYGLDSVLGTDTAWSLDAESSQWAKKTLAENFGWDGSKFLIGISAMNPYIRPIRPSLTKYLRGRIFGKWVGHYDKFYFYTVNKEREEKYTLYINAIVDTVNALLDKVDGIPVLIEMEPMDKETLTTILKKINRKSFFISSDMYDGKQMAALLRELSLLITSRYHAYVLSVPKGVPTIAISKDQRLYTIFNEDKLSEYCLSTYSDDMKEKLKKIVVDIWGKKQEVIDKIKLRFLVYLEEQRVMDKYVSDYIKSNL